MRRRGPLFLAALLLLSATAAEAQEITWNRAAYDPGQPEADMVLPLPCGGAIALTRVETKARADDPRHDVPLRLGAPNRDRAAEEGLRATYIRGAFADTESNKTYYYIGRYEITRDQWAAVLAATSGEDCPRPDDFDGVLPKTEISWFEAVDFTRRLTEWARGTMPDRLPRSGDALAFFRLPSEVEWEFATRGGTAVNDTVFNTPRFPMEGDLSDYAWHHGRESAGGEIQPIGSRQANPLGLYDVYGNASEMVLDLFQLNNLGREHGQTGGFVSRGGSYKSLPASLSSAARAEYPFYGLGESAAFTFPDIGFRVVLTSHVFVSSSAATEIREEWGRSLEPRNAEDPLSLIDGMIKKEVEERRVSDLEALRAFIVADRQARDEALALALRRTIFSGVTLMRRLGEAKGRLRAVETSIANREKDIAGFREQLEALPEDPTYDGARKTLNDSMTRSETRLRERLWPEYGKRQRTLKVDLRNYGDTLAAIYGSATLDAVQSEAENLADDLRRGEQDDLIALVSDYVGEVSAYWENPAMSESEMLDRVR